MQHELWLKNGASPAFRANAPDSLAVRSRGSLSRFAFAVRFRGSLSWFAFVVPTQCITQMYSQTLVELQSNLHFIMQSTVIVKFKYEK